MNRSGWIVDLSYINSMQETFGYSDRIESRIDANDGNMNCYMIA